MTVWGLHTWLDGERDCKASYPSVGQAAHSCVAVFSVQRSPGKDGQLVPRLQHVCSCSMLPALFHHSRPVFSPDGSHVALCGYTALPQDAGFQDCLFVFSFASRAVRSFQLAPWPAAQADFEVCWQPVHGAVLVAVNYAGSWVQKPNFA